MKQLLIVAIILMVLYGSALAQDYNSSDTNQRYQHRSDTSQRDQQQGFAHFWNNESTYMQPYKHDAYAPGVHSDATGKPFEWKIQDGQNSHSNRIESDAYGLGVGMDEYGRPVKPSPWGQ